MIDKKHWMNIDESLWDNRRKASKWHFDPDIKEESSNLVKNNFVKFVGDWQQELQKIVYNETPSTDLSKPLVRYGYQDLLKLGVHWSIQGNRVTVNESKLPTVSKIVNAFGLKNTHAQILNQKPGEMSMLHIDVIAGKPRSLEEAAKDEEDVRLFVMLEDWCWGQYMIFGNFHWTNWKAGDTLWFRWQDIPHATSNCGHQPRALLKITGKKTAHFQSLLEQDTKKIIHV